MRKIRISILNVYSSLILRIDGRSILFDPLEIDPHTFHDTDAIVVTHEHMDHFDRGLILKLQDLSRARILTTNYVAEQLADRGASVVPMQPGDSHRIAKGIHLYAEHAQHHANAALTFFIRAGGTTLFYPNDSDYFPGMSFLREKYRPVGLIFVGNTTGNLKRISEAMRPTWIITHRYPDIPSLDLPGTTVISLKTNEWYELPDQDTEG